MWTPDPGSHVAHYLKQNHRAKAEYIFAHSPPVCTLTELFERCSKHPPAKRGIKPATLSTASRRWSQNRKMSCDTTFSGRLNRPLHMTVVIISSRNRGATTGPVMHVLCAAIWRRASLKARGLARAHNALDRDWCTRRTPHWLSPAIIPACRSSGFRPVKALPGQRLERQAGQYPWSAWSSSAAG